MTDAIDVIVIGGGPAGLAAALCLGRSRRSVLVIDDDRPRHAVAAGVHNLLTREGIPPAMLRTTAWDQMREYPSVRRYAGTVSAMERSGDRWVVRSRDSEGWTTRTVLLATGVVDQHPDIPGYTALWGRSIFLCPYCHGWEVRDQPVAVLGDEPALAQFAPLLRSWTDDVVVCTNGATLDADTTQALGSFGIETRTAPIAELESKDGALDAIRFEDGSRLTRHTVFVMSATHVPPLIADLGVELDDQGFVRIDGNGATSHPGVWAAGDLTSRRHQVMEAAAQGLRAGIAINRALALGEVPR